MSVGWTILLLYRYIIMIMIRVIYRKSFITVKCWHKFVQRNTVIAENYYFCMENMGMGKLFRQFFKVNVGINCTKLYKKKAS